VVVVVVPMVVLPEQAVAVVEVLVLFRGMVRQVQQILVAEAVVVLAHIQERVVLVVLVLLFSATSQQTQMQKV
jgi:hypothetical protein